MKTTFMCHEEGCPNKDVLYTWGEPADETAMCGGCGITLEANHE